MKPSTSPRCSPLGLSTCIPSKSTSSTISPASTYLSHGKGCFTVRLLCALRTECASKKPAVVALLYDRRMRSLAPAEAPAAPPLGERHEIPERFKWNLRNIFDDWSGWQGAYDDLDRGIEAFAALQGTLSRGPAELLASLKLRDEIGQLEYKVWYYASLWYDQDQRDNQINAKRQQVQILFAKAAQAAAWFDPELLTIPLATVQEWMAANADLEVYRFAIEDLYRQQEHVLDDKGERLLSLSSRFSTSPNEAYAALSTADVKYPVVRLSNGTEATLTYGQYRAILATNRNQSDRAAAFRGFHTIYEASTNTYASL